MRYLSFFILVLFFSCNQQRVREKEFESRINALNLQLELCTNEKNELKGDISQLIEQIDNLRYELIIANDELVETKTEVEFHKWNYEEYRYGNSVVLSRFVRGEGMVTVRGAENIIEFLNDHYCP